MKSRGCQVAGRLFALVLVHAGWRYAAAAEHDAGVTPVQKVIVLLQGMLSKANMGKHQEMVEYAGFKQFCDDVTVVKETAIQEADKEIEVLEAEIEKYDATAERLGKEIVQHELEIEGWETDLKNATSARDIERSDYYVAYRDYDESIEALGQAISVLKAKAQNTKGVYGSYALQQVKSLGLIPKEVKRSIEAFLERSSDPDLDALDSAPQVPVNAYEFQSHDIIKMLEQLEEKFVDERNELEKDEVARQHAFTMLSQNLIDSKKGAQDQIEYKKTSKAKAEQASLQTNADLKEVVSVRKSDQEYLDDLTKNCKQKSGEFADRQKLRKEEIDALTKTIEILEGESVAGMAVKHLPAAALTSVATTLAQLRASSDRNPNQLRAAAYLNDVSLRLGSHTLSTIALRAKEDPFAKVKQLIEELILRLQKQEANEADHKGWCDKELSANEKQRTTLSAEVESLTSVIDELESDIEVIKKDIATKSAEVERLDEAMQEATYIRTNESAENHAVIADAKQAQHAVAMAMDILKEFYAGAAKFTYSYNATANSSALMQSEKAKQGPPPELWDTPYRGLQGEKGGVLGMLEVIQSDFARLEDETISAEATAEAEYNQFMTESKVNKASLTTSLGYLVKDQKAKELDLQQNKDNLDNAQTNLKIALGVFEKLKPACMAAGQSYSERKARREDEIEALKQALRILEGEDLLALQQLH